MYYRVREGPITANNSMTALTTLYGISTSASIQVPANSSAIVGIIVSVATDSASNGATTFGVQLSGDGLSQGQETLTVGAQGVDGTPALKFTLRAFHPTRSPHMAHFHPDLFN